ncbi:hypothetical protein BpHYR1_028918 [Brachionus plicatilis]|uniref:Uncharacterized protein n=1 Tax=Brachionus plicatilis TaxID=10195 RepID=A0A3M7PT48_BRAPC|nr:hypothetical protein BpHYR1_028918 [Brachionus plicatilis]
MSAAPVLSGPRGSAAPVPSAAPVLSGPRASGAPVPSAAPVLSGPRASGSAAPVPSAAPVLSGPRASGAPVFSSPRASFARASNNVSLPASVSTVAAAITSPKLSGGRAPQQTFSQWVRHQNVPTSSTLERELNITSEFNLENWTREIEAELEKKRAELPTPQLPTQSFSSAKAKIASLIPSLAPEPFSCCSQPSTSLFSLDLNLASTFSSSAPVFPPYFNFPFYGPFLSTASPCGLPCGSSNPLVLF